MAEICILIAFYWSLFLIVQSIMRGIGSGNALTPIWRQSITWINDEPTHQRIFAQRVKGLFHWYHFELTLIISQGKVSLGNSHVHSVIRKWNTPCTLGITLYSGQHFVKSRHLKYDIFMFDVVCCRLSNLYLSIAKKLPWFQQTSEK